MKLVIKTSLYYDARSEKHQIIHRIVLFYLFIYVLLAIYYYSFIPSRKRMQQLCQLRVISVKVEQNLHIQKR
jgi:hypothetical protein